MTRRALAILSGGFAVALLARADAQTPMFSSKLEVVRLDVLVTAGGKPLRGLTLNDFDVFDNDVRQTLDLSSFEETPLAVVLALDVSASLTAAQLDDLRAASRAALDALKARDQSALVTFSEAVSLETALTGDASAVTAALARVEARGDTALIDGVYASITAADTPHGRGLVIVFSDGSDTASWLTVPQVVDAARRADVVVYGVASGRTDDSFLRAITEDTGGRLYEIDSTASLRDRFQQILAEFRERYVLSYTPRGVAAAGWHTLEVRVRGRSASVRARQGYFR